MDKIDSIIEGCKRGDATMQRELYRLYSPRFYAVCRRYAADDEMAKSSLLDGFLTVFQNIGNYRNEGSFEGWLHKIFLRTTIHAYRKQSRYRARYENVPDTSAIDERLCTNSVDLDSSIDVNNALIESLRSLSGQQQTIFNLVAVEGYSFRNAADIIKQKESSVKYHYYNACEKMKTLIISKLGEQYVNNLIQE